MPNQHAKKFLTWDQLIHSLETATETQVLNMLEKEMQGSNRLLWKTRMYQRFSKMRREREHLVFLKDGVTTKAAEARRRSKISRKARRASDVIRKVENAETQVGND